MDTKLKILFASHCGSMGPRGATSTTIFVTEQFNWDGMPNDFKEFVKHFLYCIISHSFEVVPQSHVHALHGKKPNYVIHADYLYMGPSAKENLKYILIIRYKLSSYVCLWPTVIQSVNKHPRRLQPEWLCLDLSVG